jgi:hypothetical protein
MIGWKIIMHQVNIIFTNKIGRQLTPSQKKIVLNRDGWCCNKCGYIPFYRFGDTPSWSRSSYPAFWGYMRDIQNSPPVIFVKWNILPDKEDGSMNLDLCYLHGGELEFDHILPVYKGGSLELDNIQALCNKCHKMKSNMDYRYTESMKCILAKWATI